MTDWRVSARRLADRMWAHGDLRTPAWYDAVVATPRHVLVPRAWRQDEHFAWVEVDTAALAYEPTSLVTEVVDGRAVSSSTKPDLVMRLLELLDVAPGAEVLEIGTGSGYTCALLCHRLGDSAVTSIDVDPQIVALARERLAELGRHPHLTAGDGAAGVPERAPYDRILATCSVPRVPTAWIPQLRLGGRVLVSVMPSVGAGNLCVLHREGDRLVGRFSRRTVTFMPMRPAAAVPHPRPAGEPRYRTTDLLAEPWRDAPIAWMLAALDVPGLQHGYVLDDATHAPVGLVLSSADGSRAEVRADAVSETGPSDVWRTVEQCHHEWQRLGSPGWERAGLVVDHLRQELWIDDPASRPVRSIL